MDTASAIVAGGFQHALLARIDGFVRMLRGNGYGCGIQTAVDVAQALSDEALTEPRTARWKMRSLLCGSRWEWQAFDELYEHYWFATRRRTSIRQTTQPPANQQRTPDIRDWPQQAPRPAASAPQSDAAAEPAEPPQQTPGERGSEALRSVASTLEAAGRRSLGVASAAAERRAIEQLAERMARDMRRRHSARLQRDRNGKRVDLASTIRDALSTGGEPLRLAWARRKPRQPRLTLVLDVSASMNPYSMLMLRFARGLCGTFAQLRVFAFHTRLVDLSRCLHEPSGPRMAARLAGLSEGWSGGTRIGPALQTLSERHGRDIFRCRSSLIIVSDGLDTADPSILEAALKRLKTRCRRLYWLNPLLGRAGYEPRAEAMRRALPFLDAFVPAHDLDSLLALEPLLRRC